MLTFSCLLTVQLLCQTLLFHRSTLTSKSDVLEHYNPNIISSLVFPLMVLYAKQHINIRISFN